MLELENPMFIKKINPDRIARLQTGERIYVVDQTGAILAEGDAPERSKDGVRRLTMSVVHHGVLDALMVERDGEWLGLCDVNCRGMETHEGHEIVLTVSPNQKYQ